MAMLNNLDLIRRVNLFARLTPSQAELLAGSVVKKRFKRGECIVVQGQTSEALFIILTGRVRVVMADDHGGEVILATLRAGDYLGEMSLIDNAPHSASVKCEAISDVLILGREEFGQCLSENFALAQAIMRGLVQRLRSADQKIGSLALMGVYSRVANVMLEYALPDEEGHLMIREKISRQDIAKMVGASREMVSRVMKDLEAQGFLQTLENGQVQVHERRLTER